MRQAKVRTPDITRALAPDSSPQGRTALIYGTRLTNAGEGVIITNMPTIYNPHTIRALQVRGGSSGSADFLIDVLLSSDPLTDAAAPYRDIHVSGLPKDQYGAPAPTNVLRIPIGLTVNRSITYYKLLTRNVGASNTTLQAVLELVLMGLR